MIDHRNPHFHTFSRFQPGPRFADASYHCSDAMSPCCSSCRNVTQEAQRVCRAAKSSCDRAELCPGGTAECPRDEPLGAGGWGSWEFQQK
jgi:hypothetical protein